ncbi:MAG TPA: hypothetical protein VHC49_22545 [Mycobacteriales bacterium]|nr:hypothetical protein [Mycobacteriales bacterium]
MRGRPFPTLAVLMVGTTTVLTCLRTRYPGISAAVRRDRHGLEHGQVWRLVSPVLSQPDPPLTCAVVFLCVLAAGIWVEMMWGHRCWLALYLTGALVGHSAGFLWQPGGSGASVAGCGLLGGILIWLLRGGPVQARFWAVVWLGIAVVDTIYRDIHGLPIIAGALAGAYLLRDAEPPLSPRRMGE